MTTAEKHKTNKTNKTKERFEFQAETKKLLNLMISSIYSSKEIFLRELISNASDALDRLRFEALTKTEFLNSDTKQEIRIEYNKKERTLTIHDNGIGMTRSEVIKNIGTIAKSGTEELMKKIQKSQKSQEKQEKGASNPTIDMIGQFGVGFYSIFMVADKVTMLTCKAGGSKKAILWTSSGDGSYEVADGEKESHGTSITITLKKTDSDAGLDDFTESHVIERVVKKYSDFINYPIILRDEREEPEKDKDGKIIEGGKSEIVIEDKTLNSMKPIWTKNKSDVKDEEYEEFYKHIAHDWNKPFEVIPFKAEGRIEYTSLLFIPSQAPFDLFYQNYESGLQLYIKKVLIVDNLEDLLPIYLRFVKGVVDSPSLPLNISREMLQKDIHITLIKKGLTSKILSTLKNIFEKDRDRYTIFWQEFGVAIKEGLVSDYENKEKLMNLLLYPSSFSEKKLTSLKEYRERMPDGQKSIYYVAGDSREIVENSPHIEVFKEKGYEILFLLDPIDEMVVNSVGEFDGKKIVSVENRSEELINEKDKEQNEKNLKKEEEEMSDLLKHLQSKLDSHVKEVKVTDRLVSAPACVVGDSAGLSPHLEKLLKKSGQEVPSAKKILELNPKHPIVTKMHTRFKNDNNDPLIEEYGELLYGYGILTEGGELTNIGKFSKLISQVMEKAI